RGGAAYPREAPARRLGGAFRGRGETERRAGATGRRLARLGPRLLRRRVLRPDRALRSAVAPREEPSRRDVPDPDGRRRRALPPRRVLRRADELLGWLCPALPDAGAEELADHGGGARPVLPRDRGARRHLR